MDIWHPYRNTMYITTIDKFTKYATAERIHDRTWISVLRAIKLRIQYLGKMNKLISDGETCIVHNLIEQFFKENNITFHQTTPHNKTGNSDVERLHLTLNEHLRIMTVENRQDDDDNTLDNKIFKIINFYNNTIHSTTKMRPIDFLTGNFDKEEIKKLHDRFHNDKTKRIEKLNNNRDTNYRLSDHLVRNRNIAKNSPKYKRLDRFENNDNYVIDTSNKRRTRYYKTQIKRRFKYN